MATLVTDAFTRADAADLGANWATMGFTALPIVSNSVQISSGADFAQRYSATSMAANDHWAQCVVNGANRGGPMVRVTTGPTFYVLLTEPTQTRIFAVISGGFSLVTSNAVTWANGDIAYLEAQGTAIVAKKNGSTVLSGVDATIDGTTVGGQSAGLFITNGGAGTIVLDDFAAGDFSVGGGGGSTAAVSSTLEHRFGTRPRPFAPGNAR